MPYELGDRLVVGIASSALFDLSESDAIFTEEGEEGYRAFQESHLDDQLGPGVAFPFIRRLLSLNDLRTQEDPLVEVIILSRNDPETGMRVMRSVQSHNLGLTRAIFTQGKSPFEFMPALNMSLFLSANEADVRDAVALGLPAGLVIGSLTVQDDLGEVGLRIAFDFDGVLADDSSEQVFQTVGMDGFREHEIRNLTTPHDAGPLKDFLANVNKIQRIEEEKAHADRSYEARVRVSLLTARNAPAHERAIKSLKAWGVTVNDAFFLGGIDKGSITGILKPHIFFDDQQTHLKSTAKTTPSVHIPFGVVNASSPGQATDPATIPAK